MKKMLFGGGLLILLAACSNEEPKVKSSTTDNKESASTQPADLPYKASYTTQWSSDVSDADLKLVLSSYKDWENNNMAGLSQAIADTLEVDLADGRHMKVAKVEIMKIWTTGRDSLASSSIKMDTWHKMFATDKKDTYIVTWYDQVDTYKDGRVDSASYHDINQVKDGKIVWYAQYKRPKK